VELLGDVAVTGAPHRLQGDAVEPWRKIRGEQVYGSVNGALNLLVGEPLRAPRPPRITITIFKRDTARGGTGAGPTVSYCYTVAVERCDCRRWVWCLLTAGWARRREKRRAFPFPAARSHCTAEWLHSGVDLVAAQSDHPSTEPVSE
jgi:hypothetical protein